MGTLGYYTTIARLTPGSLARVAARRVQGVARQARYRRRELTDELALLRAYGVQHAEALPQRALGVRPGAAWCEVDQRAAVLEALAQLPGAEARALARAEAALAQRFDVFGTEVCFGEGRPRVGHSWPREGGPGPDSFNSWMSSLDESGCAPGINLIETGPPDPFDNTVGSGGGYGGFYCFALNP